MRVFEITLSIGLLLSYKLGAFPSLFFTEEELVQTGHCDKQHKEVHLQGILYSSPTEWSVWVNGKVMTPQTHSDDLRILKVSDTEVRFQWNRSNDADPYIYLLNAGEVFTAID